MESTIHKVSMYWLLAQDLETGEIKNAKINARSGESFEKIKARFEERNSEYLVVQGGEGLENRPESFTELPDID